MNPGIFGSQAHLKFVAYTEPWNIQKFNGIYIPVKQIVISSRNSSRPQLFFARLSFLAHFSRPRLDSILNTPMHIQLVCNL